MVNFKFLSLPLLVDLLFGRNVFVAGDSSCIFTFDGTKASTTFCTTSGHYYATKSGSASNDKMIYFDTTKSANDQIKDAEPGIYKIGSENYVCPSATSCIKENKTSGSENYIDQVTTVGYYKINNNYYSCPDKGDGTGTIATTGQLCKKISYGSGCVESTIGQLVQISSSTFGLCLAEYLDKKEYPTLPFPTAVVTGSPQYFVKHVKKSSENSVVFSFDATTNYYVVEPKYLGGTQNVSAITFKAAGETRVVGTKNDFECADAKTGKHITRIEDFCTIGAGKYFQCNSGKCKSYDQSNPDVQELNGEKCVYDIDLTKYSGNCKTITSASINEAFYLIDDNSKQIIDSSSSSDNKIIQIQTDGTALPHTGVGYFRNADPNTNENYPLILCGEINKCKLIEIEAVGYYVNIDEDTSTNTAVIQCTSTKSCSSNNVCADTGCVSISGSTVTLKDIIGSDHNMDRANGVDEQYLLYDVKAKKFPSVTVDGNYAVQMKISKKIDNNDKQGYGTITLNKLAMTCTETPDNEIIKQANGKFYYCAGGVAVEMKNDGAVFAISVKGDYKIIKISKTKADPVDTKTRNTYIDYLGYYIDRTSTSNVIVECEEKEKEKEGGGKEKEMECNPKSVDYSDDYEVFINNEKKFPDSAGIDHSALIFVCSRSEGNCKVPEVFNGKYNHPYIKEKILDMEMYYINHQNSKNTLITCKFDTNNKEVKDCKELKKDESESHFALFTGIYINGVKDLSLIKCNEENETNDNGEEETKIVCDTMESVENYNGYYVNHLNDTTIYCGISSDNNADPVCTLNDYGSKDTVISKKTYYNSDSSSDNRIIKCGGKIKSTGSDRFECKLTDVSQNYYIDNSSKDSTILIKCNSSDNTCIRNVKGFNRNVFISGDGEDIITCTSSACEYKNTPATADNKDVTFYLNSDTIAENPIITAVEVIENNPSRKKRANTYKWAAPEEKPKSYSVYINKNASGADYGIIYCTSETVCIEENTTSSKFYMDYITPRVIQYVEGADGGWKQDTRHIFLNTGETCPVDKKYIFLVNKLNSEIIISGGSGSSLVSCECSENKWTCDYVTSGISNYYVYKFSSTDNPKLITYSNNEFTISSQMENGYYINNENIIKCYGSGCKEYTTVDECTTANIGAIISNNNELCIGYDSNAINDSDKPKTISITNQKYLIESKKFPKDSDTSFIDSPILISVTENKIIQVKPSNDEYYLISSDYTIIGTSETPGTVYKCSKSTTTCQKQAEQSETKYYINSDTASMKNYGNIKCEKIKDEENSTDTVSKYKTSCTLSKKSGNEVYCLKASNNGKLSSCVGNCGDNASCYDIINTIGFYLPYQKNFLIKCDSKCEHYSVSAGYYASADSSNSLILCGKSVNGYRCEYEATINDGFYIGGKSSTLIKCENKLCSEETITITTNNIVYYVSGESGKSLIRCTKNNQQSIECIADSKPVVGWYINANNNNEKYLIKCTSDKSKKITCKEMNIPNYGYFISASDSTKLIKCDSSGCNTMLLSTSLNGYYLDGDTKQLIYCKNNDCIQENGNGWYIAYPPTNTIYCNNGCKELSVDSDINKNGYYLNSDKRSPANPLLQVYGDQINAILNDIDNGWYLNADKNDNNKIIECINNGIIPVCNGKALGSGSDCNANNNGKFINDNGEIKWCINEEKINLVSSGIEVFAKITGRNFIPWISDSSGYAMFSINDKEIKQKKLDGYYYDDKKSTLYYCNKRGTGICNIILKDDIVPGYYMNYSDNKVSVIRCGRYDEPLCETFQSNSGLTCDEYNVIIDGKKIKLCKPNSTESGDILNDIKVDYIYALDVKSSNGYPTFPKKSNSKYTRYILANVSKYYVKYIEGIEEVNNCPEKSNTDEKNDKITCLTTGKNQKLVQVNNLDKNIGLSSTNTYYVSNTNEVKDIEYDADTNNGYFEYKGSTDSSSNLLSKVYIKKVDKNKIEFKYECPIGGRCVRKEKADEPVLGYQCDNGILKMQKRNSKSTEVTEKVKPGVYILYDGRNPNKNTVINVYLSSVGVKCEEMGRASTGISYDGKTISIDGIQSKKLYSKFIIKKPKNSKRDEKNASNTLIIKELTSTSYNEALLNSTINIFLNSDLKKITNDVISSNDEAKVAGYICKSNGECKKIDNSGNKKYLINTAQEGSDINAVVVCGNFGSGTDGGDKCKFLNAEEGAVYENYAATGVEDAVISCTSNECKTTSAFDLHSVEELELPQCQFSVLTGKVVTENDSKSCIRMDTQTVLLKDQHCIVKGDIYKYNGENCQKIEKSSDSLNIKIFDATLRELKISKIFENHYGAILYNCPRTEGSYYTGCYVTSGYIAGTSQNTSGYSVCDGKNGCKYFDLSTLKNTCSEVGEGGLVLDNKFIKLCKSGKEVSTNASGYYPVNISVNNNFPNSDFGDNLLINVDVNNNVAVYSMVLTDGYLLINSSNAIVKGETLTDSQQNPNPSSSACPLDKCSIYKCESNNRKCIIVDENEKQYGFFTSSSYSKDLITCSKNSNKVECKLTKNAIDSSNSIIDSIITDSINNSKISFSNDSNDKYYSITSKFPGYSDSTAKDAVKLGVIAKATKYNITSLKADNYVLLNSFENKLAKKDESREMKNLYFCNSSVGKCIRSDIEDGWYISGQNNYEAIRCENGSCEINETINRSCSGEGDFVIKENMYQYCIIKNKSITAVKLSENIGKLILLTSTGSKLKFPNNKTYTVVYSNSIKGIGYNDSESTDTPTGLTLCTSVNISGNGNCIKKDGNQLLNGEYCLFGTKIYSNVTEASVSKCKQQYTEGVSVEVFFGTKIATSSNIANPGSQMFYCKNGECRVTTGYKKLGSTYYRCNYSQCKIAVNGNENGDLKSGGKIVTTDGEKSFVKDTYFYIDGTNNFPGTETYKSFIVEIGADYAVPFIGNGYYLFSSGGTMLIKDPKEEEYNNTAKNNNKLYLCNDISKNCVIQQAANNLIENIYYRNAGSSNSNKLAIIGCYNTGDKKTNCVIAEDNVIFDETYNKCEFSGKLVRTTSKADIEGNVSYGEYKLCIKRKEAPVNIANTTGKYFMLSLTKNDTFAGIELTDEKLDDNYKRNVLVEIKDGIVSQYEKEGYILYNVSTNEIIDSIGSTKGALYYCGRSENYDNAGRYSYECKPEKNINNGWYFNSIYSENKRLIKCVDGVCYLSEIKESNKCQYSGSIIYNGGFKICQTTEKLIDITTINESDTLEVIMNVELMTEFPGMKTNKTDILLTVMPNKAYQVKLKTNVVTREDNTVVSGVKGNLYECYSDGHCNKNVVPKDNYFVKSNSTGYDVELVKCENRQCIVVKDELGTEKGNKEGFRVGVNTKTPLIQCTQNGIQVEDGRFLQKDISICVEREYKEGWYINSGSDSDTKPLIECTKESGCVTKKPSNDGWYLNAGYNNIYSVVSKNNSTVYPIIRCEGGNCNYYKEVLAKECTKGGDVVMPYSGSFKVCKSATKMIDFSKSSNVELINNEGSFPGSSGNIIVIPSATSIVSAKDGFYYKENLYECHGSCTAYNNDDKDGKMYYDEISKNLVIGYCKDGSCTWTPNKIEGNVFLDDANVLVTNKSNGVSKIYECLRNASKSIVCKEVLENNTRGYFFNNEIKDESDKSQSLLYLCINRDCQVVEDIPKCSELTYKKNYCYIGYDDEQNTDIYPNGEPIIVAGDVCISNVSTNSQKYYFAINEINTGIDNVNCISMPVDNSESYYQVGNVIYSQNKYNIRRINYSYSLISGLNSNSIIKDSRISDKINGVLLEDHDNFVNCLNGKCEVSKVLSCTYNFQTEKCSITSGSVNAAQICKSTEGNIYFALEKLSSNGGKCVSHKTSWKYSEGSDTVYPNYENGNHVIDEKYESTYYVVDGKMYKIEYDNDVYSLGEGVYIIDEANKKVDINKDVDISKDSKFTMYVCTSNGCKIKNSCNNGSDYEFIYNYEYNSVIRCDPNNNKVSNIYDDGYYLNSPWEDLIRCLNGKCVNYNNDIGLEGYYLNQGNKEKIIKCIRDKEKLKCTSEIGIQCTYNSKESICSSTVDLLRNSYCLYIVKDKKGNMIGNPTILYIENYIKGKDVGKCISTESNEIYYYHIRKSKFLGNNERDEIIKLSKNAISSVYEKELGYYIITTDTRKGLSQDTKLNKSRLYECTSKGCVEERNPVNNRIYVNKASSEKMVRYNDDNKQWEILKRHCKQNQINRSQCELPSANFKVGDILYIFEDGDLNPVFKASKFDLSTKNTLIEDNNDIIDTKKYQYFNNDGKMYIFNDNKQYFDIIEEEGYYMFKRTVNYHNLEPYRSTVNTTNTNEIMVYRKSDRWFPLEEFGNSFTEGYYLNKADRNGEGIAIQVMNVPSKADVIEGETEMEKKLREENSKVRKFKAVLNNCISIKKNLCLPKQEAQVIPKGGVCVVTEGDFKGLYLAIENISKGSSGNNCIKYDDANTYYYINNNVWFASEPKEKVIIEVQKNKIIPFTSESNIGYYIIEKNEKKLLNSTNTVDANAYYCGWNYDLYTEGDNIGKEIPDTKKYQCNPETTFNRYIRSKRGDVVFGKSANKWYKETKKGYYFFNDKYLAAKVNKNNEEKEIPDTIAYTNNVSNSGTYLNSAITGTTNVIVEKDNGKQSIKIDYNTCIVTGETCKSAKANNELSNGEVCLGSVKNNLYLVEVVEQDDGSKKRYCYNGSDKLKYRYVNNMLYRLDGLSVQEVERGYYVLNKSWEEFSSTYPEVPNALFYCDGRCELLTSLNIDSDVLINKAGTGSNKLLKYFPSTGKFVNVYEPGYYLLNSKSEVSKDNGYNDYVGNMYYLTESGVLETLPSTFGYDNIYINKAKTGSLTRYYSKFENPKVAYNTKTGLLEYEGKSNIDGENILVYIDGLLYKQFPQSFEVVKEGLYAIKGNKAFKETEWTELSTTTNEICYYKNGFCDSNKLALIMKEKYAINNATEKPSIIEYGTEGWRMVVNDGVYIFFEDGNSITTTDRRVDRVFEVVEGQSIEITNDENRLGYYRFNGMIIESNSNRGWEDGIKINETVNEENKRQCTSYELGEVINSDKLCYNNDLGVCLPKNEISNENAEQNNCIFSADGSVYYFSINDNLFSISSNAMKSIKKSGLYVVNINKKVYEDRLEHKAIAYDCNNSKCAIKNELSTGYYLNMANEAIDEPVILYYNSDSKTWRKTAENGFYFFNSKGYALNDGEEVEYAYSITEEGNEIEKIMESQKTGIYINFANCNVNIIIENTGKWEKAKKIPGCNISGDGLVKSFEIMKVGDLCLDEKKLVFISGDNESTKRSNEYRYRGITAEGKEIKYGYDSNNSVIVKLQEGNIVSLNVSGYIIIDRMTSMPIDKTDGISEGNVYKCGNGKCVIADMSSMEIGNLLVNIIAEDYPLLKYEGKDKWSIVNEEGYYFFGNDSTGITANSLVVNAIEVGLDQNENIVHYDISNSKKLGFYFNKAKNNEVLIGNDEAFWSKGILPHTCNITEIEGGFNCRTFKESLELGDYCYDGEKFFLLTGDTDTESEGNNCIAGSNDEPLFVSSDKAKVINGIDTGTMLVRLTDDSIKVVSPGYYILNENGTLVESNGEKGEIQVSIYHCDEKDCIREDSIERNVMFLTESGEIFEFNEEGVLMKITQKGLYFFNEKGKACSSDEDTIAVIIEITENGEKRNIDLDGKSVGYYVNNANNKSIGGYDGKEWKIIESECKFNAESKSCISEVENLEVGSYCLFEGKIYVIHEINEEKESNICIPGNDNAPIYIMKEEKLFVVKSDSINVIDDEGYYAINKKTRTGLQSNTPIQGNIIKCVSSGDCVSVKPEKRSSYLNKAVTESNIVKFNDKASLKKMSTDEKHCKVNGNNCSVEEGKLNAGDLCVADNALYFIKDDSECVMVEQFVERYQFVNNRIYKLGEDSVVQKIDGYYFMNGDNRIIGSAEDYSNPDTVGYMCSVKGDCYLIDPDSVRYYKDYTTDMNGKFRVVKFNPKKKGKREESSGYEAITEGGIYKLDDGSYVDCEVENNDEVYCKNIVTVGTKITIDDELVSCSKNEKGEVECIQANEGGYYFIHDKLMECISNDGRKLECSEVMKEGYFLSDNKNELYECNQKAEEEVNISRVIEELLGMNEVIETIKKDNILNEGNDTLENKIKGVNEKRENEELGEIKPENKDTNPEGNTESNKENYQEGNGEPEKSKKPVEMVCRVIECNSDGLVINSTNEKGIELYVCKRVEKEKEKEKENEKEDVNKENEATDDEDEEENEDKEEALYEEDNYKWVVNKDCDSGNYLKVSDDNYKCEETKKGIDQENIVKPNEEHTATDKTEHKTTKKSTMIEMTTTTTSAEEKTTTKLKSTTQDTTAAIKTTTTTKDETTKTTTTKTTTTKTNSTNEGSSGVICIRSIPSIALYIVLFVIALLIHL